MFLSMPMGDLWTLFLFTDRWIIFVLKKSIKVGNRRRNIRKRIKGVIPPIISPVGERENVDEKMGFRHLLNHCVESGLHGIFVAGSNGETMGLTQSKRDRTIKIAISEVGDRVPVL